MKRKFCQLIGKLEIRISELPFSFLTLIIPIFNKKKIIMERYGKNLSNIGITLGLLSQDDKNRTEYLKDSKSLYLNGKHLKEIIIKNIAGTRKSLITTSPYYLVINSDNSLSTEKNNDGGSIC